MHTWAKKCGGRAVSGIILLIVAALWLTVLFWVVQKIGNLVPPNRSQKLLKIVLFAVLLPLPLMDELMAKSEVDEFCRKNSTVVFDVDKLQGRSIRFLQYKSTPVFFGTLKGTDQ